MQGLVETGSFKEAVKYVNFKVLSGNIQCCSITSFEYIYLRVMKLKHLSLQLIHIQKYR